MRGKPLGLETEDGTVISAFDGEEGGSIDDLLEVVEEVTEDGWSVQVSEPAAVSVPAPCPGAPGAAKQRRQQPRCHNLGVQRRGGGG